MDINVSFGIGLGPCLTLQAESDEAVASLLERAAHAVAVRPDSISLVKNNKVLDPWLSLKKVAVKDGDALKLLPRNPVGGALSAVTKARMVAEVQSVRDARVPLQAKDPQHWHTRLVIPKGPWKDQRPAFELDSRWPTSGMSHQSHGLTSSHILGHAMAVVQWRSADVNDASRAHQSSPGEEMGVWGQSHDRFQQLANCFA